MVAHRVQFHLQTLRVLAGFLVPDPAIPSVAWKPVAREWEINEALSRKHAAEAMQAMIVDCITVL